MQMFAKTKKRRHLDTKALAFSIIYCRPTEQKRNFDNEKHKLGGERVKAHE